MTDLQSIAQQIGELAQQVAESTSAAKSLTLAGHWFAGLIAIFTAALFITSVLAFNRTSEATSKGAQLAALKESQVALLLNENEAKAAQAMEATALANERAEALKNDAAQARLELEQIKRRQLNRRIDVFDLTNELLEFSPLYGNQSSLQVSIIANDDDESANAAGLLRHAFIRAGFNVIEFHRSARFHPGINVYADAQSPKSPNVSIPQTQPSEQLSIRVQRALVEFLKLSGHAARESWGQGPGPRVEHPEHMLLVEVGPDPRYEFDVGELVSENGGPLKFVPIEPAPIKSDVIQQRVPIPDGSIQNFGAPGKIFRQPVRDSPVNPSEHRDSQTAPPKGEE